MSRKVIICTCLMLASLSAFAGLPVRNLNPFVQFSGLPQLQPAEILASGEQQFSLASSVNSYFVTETDEMDPLFIDGESYMGDFVWRRGFEQWELFLMLPYVSYQKGFMDNFVDHWHEFFRLPDGGRALVENNQLTIAYYGKDSFMLDEPAQGIGDIRLQAGYQWINRPNFSGALYASLKLPTGDEKRGIGSGGADLAMFTSWAWQQGHWRQELQAGVLGMQQPEVLSSMRRKVAVFGSVALAYVSSEGIALYLQLDSNSRLYKRTDQPALKDAHMLSAGWKVSYHNWDWSFAVTEDVDVDSAPDIGFQLGFSFRQ